MLALVLSLALSQSTAEAARAFERGDYSQCLSILDDVERRGGPTPRTASMRAQAADAAGLEMTAFEALRVYFALLGGRTPASGDAHRELVAMFARLKESLKRQYEAKNVENWQGNDDELEEAERAEEKRAEAWAADRKAKLEKDTREGRNRTIVSDAIEAHRKKKRP